MRFSKVIKLGARVFTPEDVKLLAAFLEKQARQLDGRCDYEASFSDNTTIKSDQIDLFHSSYFTRKDVDKISMSFYDRHSERTIRIELRIESFYPYEFNTIWIDSTDEDWFNAACNSLTEIIGGIKKRHPIFRLTTPPWIAAPVLGLPLLTVLVIYGLLKSFGEPEAGGFIASIHPILLFLVCVIVLAICLTLICRMYPPIEFTYDAPRHRKRIQLRKACGWILATLLIPIVLSFFF